MPLEDYIQAFRKLRVNTNSPHKPIMLLSVIQLFEEGRVLENRIEFNPDLLDIYRSLFAVVAQPTDHANPHFPFFHLKNDCWRGPFWILNALPGRELVLQALDEERRRYSGEPGLLGWTCNVIDQKAWPLDRLITASGPRLILWMLGKKQEGCNSKYLSKPSFQDVSLDPLTRHIRINARPISVFNFILA